MPSVPSASGPCRRCLARAPASGLLPLSPLARHAAAAAAPSFVSRAAPFGTAAVLAMPQPTKAKVRPHPSASGPPKKGEKTTFATKKKTSVPERGNRPAPGERKALRRRIVLSNTNAVEVPDMVELTAENMADAALAGSVVAIPDRLVDQLRAVEAFKTTQSWAFFRRPAMLVRRETLALAGEFEAAGPDTAPTRRIVTGERVCGKSMLVLQAMCMAFLKQWVVISIPEAQELANGHTEYGPLPGSRPTSYVQKAYTARLLLRTASANPVLSTLGLSREHRLPMPVQANLSLARLCSIGGSDPDIAWPVFQALVAELAAPGRPPLLLALDGLAHAMRPTAYRSSSFAAVHAHDLALLSWFLSHLSGARRLPNGGMVLAATSASNSPAAPTLDLRLSQLEARQHPSPPHHHHHHHPALPFLLATGQSPPQFPQADPFVRYDARVFEALGSPFAPPPPAPGAAPDVEVHRLRGLARDEARALMEYWARSGILRAEVSERLVGEKWSLAGGGVVGELERGCVRMRI